VGMCCKHTHIPLVKRCSIRGYAFVWDFVFVWGFVLCASRGIGFVGMCYIYTTQPLTQTPTHVSFLQHEHMFRFYNTKPHIYTNTSLS